MWNTIRTLLAGVSAGTLINVVAKLGSCSGDVAGTPAVEPSVCTASYIPLQYQAAAGVAFMVLGLLLKAFLGTGTVSQNLFLPSAPIVPEHKAGPGTVTMDQVKAL